uniref:Acetyltransferase (GNAT) family protein n=1 Tax=Megaviridae environmental sample TaxID=1737588 RepID=A0A5J6VIY2_9VIRU|nr:MAG: acetyltransferase (GNAT) family protein [Megaviridae environmental sample]
MSIRKLEPSDYNKNYLNLLKQLSDCPDLSPSEFELIYNQLDINHNIYIIEHDNKIIASITLIREPKFIHGKAVLHIEDVIVDENSRNLGYGKQLLEFALQYAKDTDCYKTILNCNPIYKDFYEKFGFKCKNIEMAHYIFEI